jgi:hypothetical protein
VGKRRHFRQQKTDGAGNQWLTPVILILATQEAEIRKIKVQSQPGQIVAETLSQKTHHKKGMAEWLKERRVCVCVCVGG